MSIGINVRWLNFITVKAMICCWELIQTTKCNMITGTYQFLLQNNILVRTKKTYNSIYLPIQNLKSLNNMHYYIWIQVMNTCALLRVLVCVFQVKSTRVFNCIYLLLFIKFSFYAWNKWKTLLLHLEDMRKFQESPPSHNSYVWILFCFIIQPFRNVLFEWND